MQSGPIQGPPQSSTVRLEDTVNNALGRAATRAGDALKWLGQPPNSLSTWQEWVAGCGGEPSATPWNRTRRFTIEAAVGCALFAGAVLRCARSASDVAAKTLTLLMTPPVLQCVFGPLLIDGANETIDPTLLPICPPAVTSFGFAQRSRAAGAGLFIGLTLSGAMARPPTLVLFCIPKPQPHPGHLIGYRRRLKTTRTPGRSPGFFQIRKLNSESSLRLLDLDLDIDTCRQIETLKRIDSLG
jgi:hypothetical protein